ncbi:MAG: ABC transporter substrate-binding protein [Clostridia bacterium]
MDKIFKKNNLIKFAIATVITLFVVIGGLVGKNAFFPKEYIGGNVLNLPYTNTWSENNLLESPWKNSPFYTSLMYRSLFLSDASFQSQEPDLAQSYAILDDGLTYEIDLKDNIYWSDGQKLTLEDVIFSIESVMLASNVNAIYTAAFSPIEGMEDYLADPSIGLSGLEIINDKLYITLNDQYPSMLQVLSQFAILPAHCFENADISNISLDIYWADPVVSGMYKVGEIVPGETVTLVRNEYYSETAPQIDEILLHIDYKFTSLDYYSTNNITEMINYRSMREMSEYKVDILFYRYLVFNTQGSETYDSTAMQDPLVRQAISYAIDRESLIYDVYLDSGTLIDSGVPRSHDSYDGFENEYNIEKAKALLAESEYDFSRPLSLSYYYTDTTSKAFMEELKEDLEAVGFTVNLFICETSADLYINRNFDLFLKGLSAFDISEWYIEYTSLSPQLSKLFGTETPFETIVSRLTREVDEVEKDALLTELQQLEHEEMLKIPLFTLGQVLYLNEERLNIPSNLEFGNTWYKYDVDFENWSIKRE